MCILYVLKRNNGSGKMNHSEIMKNYNDIADEVYNMLMNGQFIDHQSPHSDYPSSLKYTCDLMGWYSLENEFQTAINKVFNGEMTAQEFKEYSARILAEKIAEEMIEEEEE